MSPRFNTEAVLKDILAVLKKHRIPAQTFAIDLSMLDKDFDAQMLNLKTPIFFEQMDSDSVWMSLRVNRRLPFETIVSWLEANIVPPMQEARNHFAKVYPQFSFTFHTSQPSEPENTPFRYYRNYTTRIECRLTDDPYADYNVLKFGITVSQKDATSYPQIYASIGWLVDLESDGEWGLDVVFDMYAFNGAEVDIRRLSGLHKNLPEFFRRFGVELVRCAQLLEK